VSDLNDFGFTTERPLRRRKRPLRDPRCQRCGKGVHLFFTTFAVRQVFSTGRSSNLRAQNHGGGAKSWMESR